MWFRYALRNKRSGLLNHRLLLYQVTGLDTPFGLLDQHAYYS